MSDWDSDWGASSSTTASASVPKQDGGDGWGSGSTPQFGGSSAANNDWGSTAPSNSDWSSATAKPTGGSDWASGSDWGSGTPAASGDRGGSSRGGGGGCYNCGQSGHMSRDCPEPRKERGGGGGRGGGGACYNCNGSGHMSRDCPEPRKERGAGGSSCYNCNQTGHMSRDCPEPRKERGDRGPGSRGGPRTGGPSGGGWNASSSGDGFDWNSGTSSAAAPASSDWGTDNSGGRAGGFASGRSDSRGGSGRGCRNCGEDGHFARECPNPKSSGGVPGMPSDAPLRENFQPEHELENEELFSSELTVPSGINFDKYDKIEVHVSGQGAEQIKPIQSFNEAGLRDILKSNVARASFSKPTPVQKYTIPAALANRDVIACAQTGSGKTAAYLLPILHRLLSDEATLLHHASPMSAALEPSVIIFAPTRELARQITEQCRKFACGTVIQAQMVYGGINRSYQRSRGSTQGCHVLVGTIGRVHDFIRSGDLKLDYVKFLVLDEADRMLDEGFGPEVRQIVNQYGMPKKDERWTMMFSATMKGDVQRLAAEMLRPDYLFLAVGLVGGACDDVLQEILPVGKSEKIPKLIELLDADNIKEASNSANQSKILVFCEEKKKADFICGLLNTRGYMATSIHGDRLQSQREQALNDFRAGRRPILVATSVCARGLDIVGVQHVINFDLPKEIDDYVHRIGRTGRCGNTGRATSFFDIERDFSIASFLAQKLSEKGAAVPDFLGGSTGGYGGSSEGYIARDVRGDVSRVVTDDWGTEGQAVAPASAMASMAISNQTTEDDDAWG